MLMWPAALRHGAGAAASERSGASLWFLDELTKRKGDHRHCMQPG
jgi:hypothetical protein